jgi:UDP-N-acetylmuramoyl-L-alanyl-D-glutamate--2,6-diaminopimelate ligase
MIKKLKNLKKIIRNKIPKSLINFYHYLFSLLGAIFYKFPSKEIVVIGVTGTKGKTTTCYLIYTLLSKLGIKTALSSSMYFYFGDEKTENKSRITMPGRWFLQEFLRTAVNKQCEVAVIEATSEGLWQNRHKFIDFDICIFLNLHPEHIEHHGSFENYKKAKGKLFEGLLKGARKYFRGKLLKKTIIANSDDFYADYYLSFPSERKITFGLEGNPQKKDHLQIIKYKLSTKGTTFTLNEDAEDKKESKYFTKLLGKQNLYNILAALCVLKALDIPIKSAKDILKEIEPLPGHFEVIQTKNFKVIIDYAHTPDSIEELYKNVWDIFKPKRLLCLVGSAGGLRDKWKRPEIGKIAAKYCHEIVISNEDPFDEDPLKIMKEIEHGIKTYLAEYEFEKPYRIIEDRKEAIRYLIENAQKNDIIVLIGKGAEPTIETKEGPIPWNEKEVVLELINELKLNKNHGNSRSSNR